MAEIPEAQVCTAAGVRAEYKAEYVREVPSAGRAVLAGEATRRREGLVQDWPLRGGRREAPAVAEERSWSQIRGFLGIYSVDG